MQQIKRDVKSGYKILQQLFNRIIERSIFNEECCALGFTSPINSDPLPGCTSIFEEYKFDSFSLKNNFRDCFCLIQPNIHVKISAVGRDKNKRKIIIGRRFTHFENLYIFPVLCLQSVGRLRNIRN